MTVSEAYQALGIAPGEGRKEIKKKYRQLMLQIHPDVNASAQMFISLQPCWNCQAERLW